MTGVLKLPVVVQEPGRPESRRVVGVWSDTTSPPYEWIEMGHWARVDDIVSVKKRRHNGEPCWLIEAHAGVQSTGPETRMSAFLEYVVSRKCMWLAPHTPGEPLAVWLPTGEVIKYDNGDQADIDDLDVRLKRRGL